MSVFSHIKVPYLDFMSVCFIFSHLKIWEGATSILNFCLCVLSLHTPRYDMKLPQSWVFVYTDVKQPKKRKLNQEERLDYPAPKRVKPTSNSDNQVATKKLGRPKGSKKRPKEKTMNQQQQVSQESVVSEAFLPITDCCTCSFPLNGEEEEEKCQVCGIKLHSSCLRGLDGCQNCEMINCWIVQFWFLYIMTNKLWFEKTNGLKIDRSIKKQRV